MKRKLVQINTVCNGSTGRIMNQIQEEAIKNGYEAYSFFGRGTPVNKNCIKIDTKIEVLWHVFISRLFNLQGHGSVFATYRLIKKIDKINPDIIQLHNMHGYYINFKILFKYLKKKNTPVVWTLHDCWAFTGHCTYYTANNECNQWNNKDKCSNCKYNKVYPKAFFGDKRVKKEYLLKERLINDIKKITLVVPSNWLKEQVKMSFLKNKPIKVIHNFVDTSIFRNIKDSEIKEKYRIDQNKKVILGVADGWSVNKGIDKFIKLSEIIDDEKESIVMVGLTDEQIKKLPKNIIGIKKTENIEELVKLYSMADVFFNPSIQETFSMVTLESLACGTPCVVMSSTATPELIKNKSCGVIEDGFNYKKIYQDLEQVMKNKNVEECIKFAGKYDIKNICKYIKQYDEVL